MTTIDSRQLDPRIPCQEYSRPMYLLALLTAVATFPLIFMGGLVTSHGAGMSVPDWPNSYGYNMFTFPPSQWVGGIFYEHTHRLMGTVVGFCSIVLTIAAWKLENRRWVRWLATSVLGAVIFQGVLGGLRVIWVQLDLAIVHACFAQAFFCLAALVAIVTSKWWISSIETIRTSAISAGVHDAWRCPSSPSPGTPGEGRGEGSDANTKTLTLPLPDYRARGKSKEPNQPKASCTLSAGRSLTILAVACVVTVYLQLVVGAIMRHEKAGLAIPDLPLAYGKLLPPTTADGLNAINQTRAWTWQMDPVTLGQVWIHFGHRIGAIIVSLLLIALIASIIRKHRRDAVLIWPALVLAFLLIGQLTLGVLTVLLGKPADIASLHVATGALVLVTSFLIAVRLIRINSIARRIGEPQRNHKSAPTITGPNGAAGTQPVLNWMST